MKRKFIFLFLMITAIGFCQTKKQSPKSIYDLALAKKLGADDYGMKKYVVAFLKAGPNRSQDSATAVQLQAAHMANIQRMADAGQLILAGPFMDGGDLKGIYIFNVETVEKAKELAETDPAIKAGRLVMELHPWYGSASLIQTPGIHKTLQKKEF
ncbi:MAG: YciI family protein [Bacteroidia bacterium]